MSGSESANLAGMDRRAFVGACAAGAGGLLGGAAAVRGGPERGEAARPTPASVRVGPLRIRKALKFGMIGEGESLLDKFRIAREAGFEGVEMDSPNNFAAEDVVRARDEAGIEIPGVVDSVHWRLTLGDPDPDVRAQGRLALETCLRDARDYGASTVLLVPAVVNERISYDQAYARSQEEIRRVLPVAREVGVQIALENVWNGFLLSPLEAARYVDELGGDDVGWYLDIGNIVNFGWPEQWVRILGPRILKLDVKAFSRAKRDAEGLWKGFAVEIGDEADSCGWQEVVRALREIGYNGWASAEVAGGDAARLRDISRRMDTVFEGATLGQQGETP